MPPGKIPGKLHGKIPCKLHGKLHGKIPGKLLCRLPGKISGKKPRKLPGKLPGKNLVNYLGKYLTPLKCMNVLPFPHSDEGMINLQNRAVPSS